MSDSDPIIDHSMSQRSEPQHDSRVFSKTSGGQVCLDVKKDAICELLVAICELAKQKGQSRCISIEPIVLTSSSGSRIYIDMKDVDDPYFAAMCKAAEIAATNDATDAN
ncbi:MAG: hypothetical protein KDA87_22555 [Planctomycetales bacterium]|nr:hypothetical protein [Planctomycetales bacterium]